MKGEKRFRNPIPTVDIIIEIPDAENRTGIVLIQRKNPPPGWALPGGFVDYNESLEQAALREAEEETSLKVQLLYQFHTYSDPGRDPRQHTITTVYVAEASGSPAAGDDAAGIGVFSEENIPFPLAFDHAAILEDFFRMKRKKRTHERRKKSQIKNRS